MKKILFILGFLILLSGALTMTATADASNQLKSYELNANDPIYRVDLSNLKVNGNYKNILFAVWSADKGQDDLIWYSARSGPGVYFAEIPLNNHNSDGTYHVHAYASMSDGRMQLLNTTSFVYKSSAASISARDSSGVEKNYTVTVNAPKAVGGISQIKVAVWSKTNAQDDLVWYTASANGSTYTVNVPVSNHKTLGDYYVHVYALNKKGAMIFLGDTSFSVNSTAKASVRIRSVDRQNGKIKVSVSGISALSGISEVRVPVWCSGDQSDIVWYKAVRQSDGSYTADVNISNHKNHTGSYKFHVYVVMGNGIQSFTCSTTYQYQPQSKDVYSDAAASCDTMSYEAIQNKTGFYRVKISAPSVSLGYQRIEFAVWSDKNGQDDMLWFTAERAADGSYSADIAMEDFKDLGNFSVRAYAVLNNGAKALIKAGSFTVAEPSVSKVTISSLNVSAGTFRATLSGIVNPAAIKKIYVTIRCSTTNSKLYTYDVTPVSGTNTYYVDANIANMNYDFGTYIVDACVEDIAGNKKTTSYATCEIKPSYTRINQTDYHNDETVRGVFIDSLTVPGGTDQVQFAVWSTAGGQDDLIWYTANKTGSYYYYYININEHRTLGEYNVHIYATKKNGKQELIAKEKFSINATPTAKVKITNVDETNGKIHIVISDIKALSGISKVEVPVWCSSDQSDIKWYNAEKQSDGTYAVDAYVGNHKYHFGTYQAHAYVTMKNGIRCCVGGVSANIKGSNFSLYELRALEYAEQVLNRVGWDLRAAFNWSASLRYYNNGNSITGAPAGYRFEQYEAIYGFENLKGDCEVMACTFYYMAKLLGYDVHVVRGQVPLARGGYGPHCWCEINIGGTVYVFDPDFTNETKRNGYQITYGTSGTWRYMNYSRIN